MFRWILVLAPLLLVLAAEGVARLAWPDHERDPFLSLRGRSSALTRRTVDGTDVFEFTHPHAYGKDSGVTFTAVKAADTLRVLVVGSSACAGWPHRPPHRWTDYLQQALTGAFPGRQFEVINLGAHACASYRIRMIFDEAIACAPDVVVIYCGNNEFVEKRSYLLDFPGKGMIDALKAHSVLISRTALWWSERQTPANVLSGEAREHAHLHLWTHTERVATELRSDPIQYEGVKRHYRYSVEHMVAESERRGARVFVLTVPVNLRDWSPAVSATPASEEAQARLRARVREGSACLLRGDPEGALVALEQALAIEPEHAEAHFLRGKAFDRLRRFDAAYEAYSCALDADRNPFRVARPLNAILTDIVAAHPRATLVDAVAEFRVAAKDGVPGFDLMLDYVHPTREGNLVLARAVFAALVQKGVVGDGTPLAFAVPDDGYRDEDDESLQTTLLLLLPTMHQYESYLAKADAFEALLRRRQRDPPPVVRNVLANTRAAFTAYLAELRKETLGEPFDPAFRERHAAFYKQLFLFASELKGALVDADWGKTQGAR